MKCPSCKTGEIKNEYVPDYYGGTAYEKCDSCGHVHSNAWYPDGQAPWDYFDDEDYEDEEMAIELAAEECGMEEDGEWCELLGSDHCDYCPFHRHLFKDEESEDGQ